MDDIPAEPPREPSLRSQQETPPIQDEPAIVPQASNIAPISGSRHSSTLSRGSQKSNKPPVSSPRASIPSPPVQIPPTGSPTKFSGIIANASIKSNSEAREQLKTQIPLPWSPVRSPQRRTSIKEPSIASKESSKSPKGPEKQKTPTPRSMSIRSDHNKNETKETIAGLEPQGKRISDHIDQLNESVKRLSDNVRAQPDSGLDKIANMSKILTNEANALRQSIKHLSEDMARVESVENKKSGSDFPYHLFLLELIVNRIQMKCDCFDMDCNNLLITASFLDRNPIIIYDCNNGSVEDFYKINVGKSILFAMTYDKICAIEEFEIVVELTKQPPCSHSVTKLGISRLDYTKEFLELRDELCKKWTTDKPKDDILCATATPMFKNEFYLSCGESEDPEAIGVIEVSARMSFLGKEITTEFSASPKPKGTSRLLKQGNGMTMYSCQNVEMDDEGKILLDEDALTKKFQQPPRHGPLRVRSTRSNSPTSQFSTYSRSPQRNYIEPNPPAGLGEFRIRDLNDEINKLMREKRHWEVQIKSLGGPDHARVGPRMLDQDGKEVPGNRGYKYFGAAKDLPGVRELFEQEPPAPPRRTRADLMRDVDADYYGYRDDDDGLLVPLEKQAEKEAIAQAVEEWKKNKEENKDQDVPEEENIYPEDPEDTRVSDDDEEPQIITSHVAVPSQKDIEEALLRKKKQELLERYGCLDVKMEES